MTKPELTPTPSDFSLFNSIIHGKLRPHLPLNQNIESITARYQQAVFDQLLLHKAFPPKEYIITDLIDIRYPNYKIREGDRLSIKIDEQNNLIDVNNEDNTNILIDSDIPPAFTLIGAYYLFLIEKEYDMLLQQFQSVLLDTSQSPKRYVRHTFQVLKRLAVDALMYSRELEELGYTDMLYHAPAYTLHVLRLYIERSIETFQFTFHPFLKDQLLSANQIHAICFGIDRLKRIQEMEQTFKKLKSLKKNNPNEKQLPKQDLTWPKLFKNPEAADQVLELLKEDGIIATDNSWIKSPQQMTMIALYNVLVRKGYMVKTNERAKILAMAFNTQFNTTFTDKNWQPKQREDAQFHEDLFRLIPQFIA